MRNNPLNIIEAYPTSTVHSCFDLSSYIEWGAMRALIFKYVLPVRTQRVVIGICGQSLKTKPFFQGRKYVQINSILSEKLVSNFVTLFTK